MNVEIHKENMKQNSNKLENKPKPYKDISEEEVVSKLGMSSSEFKKLAFSIYLNIQNAWSEFDYKKLQIYTTDEIYNSYIMQLEALKNKNQKNMMTDIEYLDAKIIEIKEINGIINVNIYMNIRMYDYVVGINEHVIRGTKKRKANIEYVLTLVKANSKTSTKEEKCPTCGAKIKTTTSGKCTYCRNMLITKPKNYVMSKKTCIGQRTE